MPKAAETHFLPFEVEQSLTAIGAHLSRARRARGDTQQIAAERCGLHPQTIARIERGDPGVSVGKLFTLMHMYDMGERLFALSATDNTTELLYRQHLPTRGRRAASSSKGK